MTQDLLSDQSILELLRTVIDPELGINIVDLGLIYSVKVRKTTKRQKVDILMTLTTPGCPLAGTIQSMIKDALYPLKQLDVDEDVQIEITFDPPWTIEMMTEEARAELGFE